MKVAIVDYGMGNLHSVAQAVRAANPQVEVFFARDGDDIASAQRVILPGQGAMPECMRQLKQSGLQEALLEALKNKPILGICIGEQMLFDESEEGPTTALGIFPGKVVRFKLAHEQQYYKIPHMGWNRVMQRTHHPVWQKIPDHAYFYFVHSYYVEPHCSQHVIAQSDYGVQFTCAVAEDNIVAVQFHPEKSAELGVQFFRNFIFWRP